MIALSHSIGMGWDWNQAIPGRIAVVEILDREHAAYVDAIEAGTPVSGSIRFAFQVPDIHLAVENALKYGAKLVHEPIRTPWNNWNARIESPDGLQITLFQVR